MSGRPLVAADQQDVDVRFAPDRVVGEAAEQDRGDDPAQTGGVGPMDGRPVVGHSFGEELDRVFDEKFDLDAGRQDLIQHPDDQLVLTDG